MDTPLVMEALRMGLKRRVIKLNSVVIKAKINGFPVDIYLDETLLASGELPEFVTSGALHVVTSELKSNNVEPLVMAATATAAAPAVSKWGAKASSKWECPEHGSQFIRDSKWGKSYCSAFKPLDESREDGGRPDWAKEEPNEYQGQLKWFCANKES